MLDLAHGTAFTSTTQMTGGDDPAVLADAEVVVITAGAKQKDKDGKKSKKKGKKKAKKKGD